MARETGSRQDKRTTMVATRDAWRAVLATVVTILALTVLGMTLGETSRRWLANSVVDHWGYALATASSLLLLRLLILEWKATRAAERQRADEQARQVLQLSLDGYALYSTTGDFREVNPALARISGYTVDELLARNIRDVRVENDPALVAKLMDEIVRDQGRTFRSTWRHKDGHIIELDVSSSVLQDGSNRIYSFIRDVTERENARRRFADLARVHRLLNIVGEALFSVTSGVEAYERVCQLAVSEGGFAGVWVGRVVPGTDTVGVAAFAGEMSDYVRTLQITINPADDSAWGPAATSLRNAGTVVANDFLHDPGTEPWRDAAAGAGIASAACLPIVVNGRAEATVVFYSRTQGLFDATLVSDLAEVSRLLALIEERSASDTQRRAERARRIASEASFRSLFEASPLPMLVVEAGPGRVARVNDSFETQFGYTVEDLRSTTSMLARLFPKADDRARAGAALDGAAAVGARRPRVHTADVVLTRADGDERAVQLSVTRTDRELIVGLSDVTDLQRSQRQVEEAQRLARLGSWSWNFATKVMSRAGRLYDDIALDTARAPGDGSLLSYLVVEDRAEAIEAFTRAVERRLLFDCTGRVPLRGGGILHLRFRATFEYDDDGTPLRAVGSSQDVTEEVLSTLELQRYRDHLEEMVLARTSEVQRANERLTLHDRRMADMLMLSQRAGSLEEIEVLQLCVDEAVALTSSTVGYIHLVSDDATTVTVGAWSRQAREACGIEGFGHHDVTNGGIWADAVRLRHAVWQNDFAAEPVRHGFPTAHLTLHRHLAVPVLDGEQVRLLIGVGNKDAPYDEADAEEVRLLGHQIWAILLRHRTDLALVAALKEAHDANRAKSDFLAMMSHEIRTPLNGVLGMAEILGHRALPADAMDAVHTIQSSGRSLMTVIDDILDFSKIEAGRLDLDIEDTALDQLVEDVCSSLLPAARGGVVDLGVFVAPEIPPLVRCDPLRVRQILFNLLGNAIKFSGRRPERGKVVVRLEMGEGDDAPVVATVSDNGIGMSPETVSRIFEQFQQAESSTTRRFGGTGLGLAITKRLVDMMHGQIAVTSELGHGSTFTVTLPLAASSMPSAEPLPDLRGLDVIVIGQNDTLAPPGAERYLMHAGARVQRVADADDALSAARTLAAPCVVVRDVRDRALLDEPVLEAMPSVHQLVLTLGPRPALLSAHPTLTLLECDFFRARRLMHAVAVAGGRDATDARTDAATGHLSNDRRTLTAAEAEERGRLVLVAEDDPVNQSVVRQQLALLGYAAEVASNGAEALDMWKAGRYALLLADLHMPEMDGFELARQIRATEAVGARRPIVALTANAMKGEAVQAQKAGMDDYVTKPATLARLRTVLRKWIQSSSGEQAAIAPEPAAAATETRMDTASLARADLDVDVLRSLVGDAPGVVNEFLAQYRTTAASHLAAIRAALAADGLTQVAAVAHKLKSASRSVGALPLGEVCADLEAAGRRSDADTVARSVPVLEAHLESVFRAIDLHLARPAGPSAAPAPART